MNSGSQQKRKPTSFPGCDIRSSGRCSTKKLKVTAFKTEGSNKAGRIKPAGFETQQKDLSHGKGNDWFSAP